jgi:predicted PhzF superfamily epimerase YddE/YHI9
MKRGNPFWLGRIFCLNGIGGNLTAVVQGECTRQRVASRLGVPDTAFVDSISKIIQIVTFSPYEQLEQCIQTSLAVPTALQILENEVWVSHAGQKPLLITRSNSLTWTGVSHLQSGVLERADFLRFAGAQDFNRPTIIRAARSRIYVECPTHRSLDELRLERTSALVEMGQTHTKGLVFYYVEDTIVYVRVFTSSLEGREDEATGGAILGVGRVMAQSGQLGKYSVIQGQSDRGYFRMEVESERVNLGGEVLTLATGLLEP